ncbi:hypothetical protein WICMUC_005946 [Wickerhamomyces mucosus]|uniref:F-box domain-containing protein n=1 Tax=Wickerhamomyces mucosus TaxID=1378264 RepID=A0A9P8P184_9ASCO|nr:hypothetical protein WICMUC_005946 [Wickerhamomyces mucosus]
MSIEGLARHPLLYLPHEIIKIIFTELQNTDLIQLSQVNKLMRSFITPYLFNEISLSWNMIFNIDQFKYKENVEKIRIFQNNLQNEWNFKFCEFFCTFNNLVEIELLTSQSSNFMKYNQLCPSLERLRIKTITAESTFGLDHLNLIVGLKYLQLEGFCLSFEKEDVKEHLYNIKRLKLIDCSWNYPFELEFFDKDNIESLEIIYNNQCHFFLSERFKEFLKKFSVTFKEIKHMRIDNYAEFKLNLSNMNLYQNKKMLKKLELFGNIVT